MAEQYPNMCHSWSLSRLSQFTIDDHPSFHIQWHINFMAAYFFLFIYKEQCLTLYVYVFLYVYLLQIFKYYIFNF